jgi:hypothetical protein
MFRGWPSASIRALRRENPHDEAPTNELEEVEEQFRRALLSRIWELIEERLDLHELIEEVPKE